MALQDYDAALQNAVRSFNVRMRAVCAALGLPGVTVNWYPEGEKPQVPAYPCVTATILRLGAWDARRCKLLTRIQVDVWTNDRQAALARRIAGRLLTGLGISLDSLRPACDVPQTDTESGQSIPQREMELALRFGWEPAGDPDPAITHLFAEFDLFHD